MSTQVQGGDFNLYEGLRCHGVPLVTISRGRLVCENGVFMCAEGSGKFYPQRTFPDYLYKKMVQREKVSSLSLTVHFLKTKSNHADVVLAGQPGSCGPLLRQLAVNPCKHTQHVVSDSTDLTVYMKDLMLMLPLYSDTVFLLLLSANRPTSQPLHSSALVTFNLCCLFAFLSYYLLKSQRGINPHLNPHNSRTRVQIKLSINSQFLNLYLLKTITLLAAANVSDDKNRMQ